MSDPNSERRKIAAKAIGATLGGEATHLVPGELNRMGAQAILSLPRRQAIERLSGITSKLVRNDR